MSNLQALVRFAKRFKATGHLLLVLAVMFSFASTTLSSQVVVHAATAGPGNAGFNYGEALQKSILFYEAQRSGKITGASIPTRLGWRGDSQMLDGKDVNLDLTGGWVDAGDNVKFVFPMTEAVAMLAWGGIEYRSAYVSSGQLTWLQNQLRWANDWFIKAHPSANVFYGQVGSGSSDHAYWAPVEVTTLDGLGSPTAAGQPTLRPAASINPSCGGGADLAGGAAAAMAASSIFFRPSDPTYADTLLSHATQLDAFAHAYKQVYTKCIADAAGYYQSYSGYNDELVWSDIWMAKANDAKSAGSGSSYWTTAKSEYNNLSTEPQLTIHSYKWTIAWDDKSYGNYALMAQQFPNDAAGYNADTERWLDYWSPGGGIAYTPGGHAKLDSWGSFRYAANTALVAFIYADHISDTAKQAKYRAFGEQQINYILGQNPRGCSYEMGFGACPPVRPHHRTAEGSWVNNMTTPTVHRHILWGALSGSVDGTDAFTDDVGSYVSTEPADDYNAGFVGALARMYKTYGGTPLTDAQLQSQINADNTNYPHTCVDEFPVEAKINASGANFTEISAYANNRSGWPARAINQLSYRYFFKLDSANISDVTVTSAYTNGAAVTGPILWDAANKIYYVKIDFTGTYLYPGGQSPTSRRETQFRVASTGTWDPTNDPSYLGWTASYPYPNTGYSYAASMPIYDGTTKLCGNEPGASNVTPPPATNTPFPSTATTIPPTSTFAPPTNTPNGPTNTPIPATATNIPPTTTGGAVTVGIKNNGTDNNQQTAFAYQVKNTSASAVSGLSVRIYFTTDNGNTASNYTIEKYYDQSGVATISGPTLASGSIYYFTVSYGTASLAAGASWEFQSGMHLANWASNFDSSNDWYHTGYAVAALPAAYTNTNYIPAYQSGTLIWGAAPNGSTNPTNTPIPATATSIPPTNTSVPGTATSVPPTATKVPATNTPIPPTATNIPPTATGGALSVAIKTNGTDNNQQTQFSYSVKNTNSSAVSSVSVRIYFTADNGNAASNYTVEKYYDQSGVATISGPTLASGSIYYYTVSYGTASLAAGASWEFQTSLHLANWGTNFNGANDWYHTGYAVAALPASYTNTNYIPAYVNGTLAGGTTP